MRESILDFLVNQYGQRIDHPQPIINIDNDSIQNQLNLVDKNLTKTKVFGIISVLIGVAWLVKSVASLVSKLDAIEIFLLGSGVFFIILGLSNLNRAGELKRKKVILETILFVNKN